MPRNVTGPLTRDLFTPDEEARFWASVDASAGPDACWPIESARCGGRYRAFRTRREGRGQVYLAHRVAYTLVHGVAARLILHHCDNGTCGNPYHLYEGTQRQNILDVVNRGRRRTKLRLTPTDIPEIRRLAASGWFQRVIAAKYGVSDGTINKILRGRTWSHV